MTHESIKAECLACNLTVRQVPADGRRSYEGTAPGVRVYWSTSTEGGLLGLPRVIVNGRDTHARNLKEIRYLVRTA